MARLQLPTPKVGQNAAQRIADADAHVRVTMFARSTASPAPAYGIAQVVRRIPCTRSPHTRLTSAPPSPLGGRAWLPPSWGTLWSSGTFLRSVHCSSWQCCGRRSSSGLALSSMPDAQSAASGCQRAAATRTPWTEQTSFSLATSADELGWPIGRAAGATCGAPRRRPEADDRQSS